MLGAQPSWPPPRPHVSTRQHSGAPRPGPQVLGGASPSRRFQPERLPRRPRPPAQPSQRAGPAAKASPWWGPEMVPAFLISLYLVLEQRATVGQHLDRATGQEAHTHTAPPPGHWKRNQSGRPHSQAWRRPGANPGHPTPTVCKATGQIPASLSQHGPVTSRGSGRTGTAASCHLGPTPRTSTVTACHHSGGGQTSTQHPKAPVRAPG